MNDEEEYEVIGIELPPELLPLLLGGEATEVLHHVSEAIRAKELRDASYALLTNMAATLFFHPRPDTTDPKLGPEVVLTSVPKVRVAIDEIYQIVTSARNWVNKSRPAPGLDEELIARLDNIVKSLGLMERRLAVLETVAKGML